MAGLNEVIDEVSQQIQDVDTEIAEIVQAQSQTGREGHAALLDAKMAIKELFTKIREIKAKTDLSETMVKEITRDIKQLDYAKRNLTISMTTLGHLLGLVNEVEKLSGYVPKRQYKEIADMMEGVMTLLNHFRDYMHIPQIKELADQVKKNKLIQMGFR